MRQLKVEMPMWIWGVVPIAIIVISRRPAYLAAIPSALSAIANDVIRFIDHLNFHLSKNH